ncbi:MAG: hypothetical protein CL927_03640 [Deltaproteobacteria bacterium]|nr:hypothetical protein [Deltaproteobacteria bacterium]HCH67019.1 hypothetical protein [Deltaproteobacteria bacterium]
MTMITPFQMQLRAHGFDIVHPFPLQPLSIDNPHFARLASRFGDARTGLLVGNTRALWVHFLEWLEANPAWSSSDHPLDDYAQQVITQAAADHLPGAHLFWTHEIHDYIVPVQRLCHESGLAYLSRGRFNVHQEYGPWFGMRAFVALPPDLGIPLVPAVNPSAPAIEDLVAARFDALRARASDGLNGKHIRTTWEDWLKLRDLYEVGRRHRYTPPQVRYHYTKDQTVLEAELARQAGV